jgi:hypothetical protein
VIVVTFELWARYVASLAWVAVTRHVPVIVVWNVKTDPATVQLVAVPLTTLKEMAPVPEPPVVVSVSD